MKTTSRSTSEWMYYQRAPNGDAYYRSTILPGGIPPAGPSIFNRQQQQAPVSATIVMSQYNNPQVTSQYSNQPMTSRYNNPPATTSQMINPKVESHFHNLQMTSLYNNQSGVTSHYNNQPMTSSQYNNLSNSKRHNSNALFPSTNNNSGVASQLLPTSGAACATVFVTAASATAAVGLMQSQDDLDLSQSDGTVPASGENDDDDEDNDDDVNHEMAPNATEKEKRAFARRTVFTRPQLRAMEERFVRQSFLTREERIDFGDELKLTERQIMIWFQNRRGRYKKRGPADKAYQHKQANDLKWTWNLNRPSASESLPNIQPRLSVNPEAKVANNATQNNLPVQQPLSAVYNPPIQHHDATEFSQPQHEPSLHQRLNYRVTERGTIGNQQCSIAPNNACYRNDARRNSNFAVIPDVVNTALNSMKSDYCSRLPPCRRQQEASFQITTQQLHSSKNASHQGAFVQAPVELELFSQPLPVNQGFYSQNPAESEYYSQHVPTARQGFCSKDLDKYGNVLRNTVQPKSMLNNHHAQSAYFPLTAAEQGFSSTNHQQQGLYSQNCSNGGYLSQVPTQQVNPFLTDDQAQQGWYAQNSVQPISYNSIPLCCDSDSSNSSYRNASRNNCDVTEGGASYYPASNNLLVQLRMTQSHGMGEANHVRSYGVMKNQVTQSIMNIRSQNMKGMMIQNPGNACRMNNPTN